MPNPMPPPSPAPLAPPPGDNQWQLRLVVSLPTLMILITLIYGLVSYLSFSAHWEELEKAGAGPLASSLLRTHLITMLALVLVAGVTGLVLSTTILRPIRALAQATRRVGQGQLDLYAPQLPATRELDDLSRSFNVMIDNLNRSIAERNRRLMEGIPVGVMTTDLGGRVNAASPVAAEILGRPAEEVVGRTLEELRDDPAAGACRPLLDCLAGLVAQHPATTLHKTVLGSPRHDQEDLIVTSILLRDAQSAPFAMMFSFRESARLRDLSDQLSYTDQLATLGTFSLGLAHELRNPLAAIKGLGQLLLLERELPARAADYLGRMNHEVDRVDAFVRQLLDLAEQPMACLAPTRLAEVVRRADALARQKVSGERAAAITLHEELADLPPLFLEGERLAQAFAHIIQNAYEATPPGGTVTLAVKAAQTHGQSGARVEIRNTGSTIPPELRGKIFEPFYTTKERATGLGLTIAKQIVVQNGGTLEVTTPPGEVALIATFDAARPADAAQGSPA